MKSFAEIQERANLIASRHSDRVRDAGEIEDMYLLEWDNKPTDPTVSYTVSPDPRNKTLGAMRLMTVTDPIPSVATDRCDIEKKVAEKIEKVAERILVEAGRAAGRPIHYDAILSGLLYGRIDLAITPTWELAKTADGQNNKRRTEKLARTAPFIVDVWNPKSGYPERDMLGLNAYYRKIDMTYSDLLSRFPRSSLNYKGSDMVTVHYWWDVDTFCAWAGEGDLLDGPRAYVPPFIPVVSQVVEGSDLFDKPQYQVQPFLYTLLKSGFWERQNLSLTVLYHLIRVMGLSPQWIHNNPPGLMEPRDLRAVMNFDVLGGAWDLMAGEALQPILNKGLVDPSVIQGMEIAEQKSSEATLYSQVLGEPLRGSPAFSTVALLSQSGRLPLVSIQRLGGEAFANMLELCFEWLKVSGQTYYGLTPDEIPDDLQLDCALDVHLPQDKLQMANIAKMLAGGDDPLTSKAWALENILNVGQPGTMRKEIWKERATDMQIVQALQQMMQLQQQQPPQSGMTPPQGQGVPPQMQEGMPMQAGPMMPPGEGRELQGLPPQQAGMIPGMGQGEIPMEGMV